MNEMVERVACAMCAYCASEQVTDPGPPWDEISEIERNEWRAEARAAIAAMREPTESMTQAVAFGDYSTFSYGGDEYSFDYISEDNATDIWNDMIDAALK